GAPRGAHRRQPRAPAPYLDDDDLDHRRHAADRVRKGGRSRLARLDGGHDHRRPDALPAADAADHAGRLLLLRRPAGVEAFAFVRRAAPPGKGHRRPGNPGRDPGVSTAIRNYDDVCWWGVDASAGSLLACWETAACD